MNEKARKRKKRALFLLALKGWEEWHRIIKKYELKKPEFTSTAVVLLPKDDLENSYFALLYLDRMLRRRDMKSAVVLTVDPLICNAAKLLSSKLRGVEVISEEGVDALLQYYALCFFDPRFIAASLTEPSGRNGKDLEGVNGITIEELVAIGVYGIIPYVQADRPKYLGDDAELASFMSIGGENQHRFTTRKIR